MYSMNATYQVFGTQLLLRPQEEESNSPFPEGDHIDNYFRIQYYQLDYSPETGNDITWANTTACTNYASDAYPSSAEYIDAQFGNLSSEGSSIWVCPDVEELQVYNNPSLDPQSDGRSFVMVINTCSQAKKIEIDHNLTSYSNEPCYDENDNTTLSDIAPELYFLSKFITQKNVSPTKYAQTHEPQPYFTNFLKSDLSGN